MYNYRLFNANGEVLGVVSLETEDLPKLLLAGEKFILSGSNLNSNRHLNFFVTPEPVLLDRTDLDLVEPWNV